MFNNDGAALHLHTEISQTLRRCLTAVQMSAFSTRDQSPDYTFIVFALKWFHI